MLSQNLTGYTLMVHQIRCITTEVNKLKIS